jgi:Rieske Fe-S protein
LRLIAKGNQKAFHCSILHSKFGAEKYVVEGDQVLKERQIQLEAEKSSAKSSNEAF